MSSLHAQINAYDCLDRVQLVVRLRVIPDDPDAPVEWQQTVTDSIPSSGETDPHMWLRDALVALLEAT